MVAAIVAFAIGSRSVANTCAKTGWNADINKTETARYTFSTSLYRINFDEFVRTLSSRYLSISFLFFPSAFRSKVTTGGIVSEAMNG